MFFLTCLSCFHRADLQAVRYGTVPVCSRESGYDISGTYVIASLLISSANAHPTVGEAMKIMNMLGITNSAFGTADSHSILGAACRMCFIQLGVCI